MTSNKRQAIVKAALELITEHGFHGAPIAAIAKQAGAGAGTVYRYFANKDVLITALFEEIHDKVCAQALEGYEVTKPYKERFFHLSMAILRYFVNNTNEFCYLEQYLNSPYGVAFRQERLLKNGGERAPYRRLFEEGVAQRVVKDLPLVVLFALTFGPLLSVARDHTLGFVQLDESLLAQTVEACWDGIKR